MPPSDEKTERQQWMAILARASAAELGRLLTQCRPLPDYTVLRGPEAGVR